MTILRVAADEEALPFADGSLDLVVSALALQFVNDLPGTLIQIRRALKPDGLLLAALIGGDSLTELREAFAAGRKRDRRRRLAARRALRRRARTGRAAAARGLCAAGCRHRPAHRALRFGARSDARTAPHGRDQHAARAPPHAAQARDARARWPTSMASASPTRTAACARPSRSSGCRAGRRTKASRSRSSPARPSSGSPMRSAPGKFRPEKSRTAKPERRSSTCDAPIHALHRGAQRIDDDDDGAGDAGRDQGVFDGRCALCRGRNSAHSAMLGTCAWSLSVSSCWPTITTAPASATPAARPPGASDSLAAGSVSPRQPAAPPWR